MIELATTKGLTLKKKEKYDMVREKLLTPFSTPPSSVSDE